MSLITPLLDFNVFVGSHCEGEGVIKGESASAAATGFGAADDLTRGIATKIKVGENLNMMNDWMVLWDPRRG